MRRLFSITFLSSLLLVSRCALYKPYMRPSPYSPSFAPDCDLIVPTVSQKMSHDVLAANAGLQYLSNYIPSIKRSSYYAGGGQICISYEDINRAVHEAKGILGGYLPAEVHELSSDLPKAPHIAVAAEILIKASQLLAKWYGLTREAILFGLPKIDTYSTAVQEICPTFLMPVKCEMSKYRTLTGMCNNIDNPSWGSARSAMVRFLPPDYADVISEPRRAKDGSHLPLPRIVSFVLHQDISDYDRHITYLTIAWGQMLDHDMTQAAAPSDEFSVDKNIECCPYPPEDQHPSCLPLKIPDDDPFYKFFHRKCMDFVRALPGIRPKCPLGPRSQVNVISSYIDANFVYGSTQELSTRLRVGKGGRLKSTPLYHELGMKDLLPMKTHEPESGCERTGRPKNLYCFEAGDERANEQLQLTVMHTVWMREHNRIADIFHELNPHWDDETIYQETRRLVGAMIQHITFNEFLPIIIGRKNMAKYGLDLMPYGYYEGYNPKINGGIRTAFQAAAFRFGHSILPDVTERYDKYHQKIDAIRLSTLLRQPYELYKPGAIDSFILGLANQASYRMDPQVTTEVTNHLFEKPGERFGLDLAAMNTLRAREMGVPGYNAFREYCGYVKAKSFYDLAGIFDNKTLTRFTSLYRHVDDIDLWSAGIAEYPLPGSLLGPTFSCIIGEQFSVIRRGDRFWYENKDWPSQFTPEQLTEIRKSKVARLLCDNGDDISTMQLYPMLRANPISNPRVDCHDLPVIDLSYWRDTRYIAKA